MRLSAYVVLVLLAFSSVLAGQLWVALVVAGVKAFVVAMEYMELRHAARAHAVGFTLGLVGLVVGLVTLGTT